MNFVLTLPEQHPLNSKRSIYLCDTANETFIMTPKSIGALYYETFMRIFKKGGFTPIITIQAHNLQAVLALVAAGMGVTLTPSSINSTNGIIRRRIEDVNLTINGLLAWRKDNKSKILDEFLAFFFEFYQDEIDIIKN